MGKKTSPANLPTLDLYRGRRQRIKISVYTAALGQAVKVAGVVVRRRSEANEEWQAEMGDVNPAPAPMAVGADAQTELLAKFFRGLGDPTRLQILEILVAVGEQNVSELVARL